MQTSLLACNRCVHPPAAIQLAHCELMASLLFSGGRVVLVGMGSSSAMRLPLSAAAIKEIDVIGSFRYANTYPLCISLMSSKRVDVLPLVTHRFGWSASQLLAGFEAAASGNAIKVMFTGLAERAQM